MTGVKLKPSIVTEPDTAPSNNIKEETVGKRGKSRERKQGKSHDTEEPCPWLTTFVIVKRKGSRVQYPNLYLRYCAEVLILSTGMLVSLLSHVI